MKYFKSEEEFWKCYQRFNALCGDNWLGWKLIQARAGLEDMFGLRISSGDMYFRKQTSYEYGSEFKLSMTSMERILLIVMIQNAGLNEFGEKILRGRRKNGADHQQSVNYYPKLPGIPLEQQDSQEL
jgi:hypothetical protein